MAIYHYSAQIIGRSQGRSAIACAAYRAGEKLFDIQSGEEKNYTRKDQVEHTQIYAPDNAPEWATDRQELWNQVHAVETRKNSQFCREINIAMPRELNPAQQVLLTEKFVKDQYVSRGMVADVCWHNLKGENPHAHIMLTTRQIGPEGFGKKERSWNDKKLLQEQRGAWARHCNRALENSGRAERVDHRSLEAQGVGRVPQIHLGPKPARERVERWQCIRRANEALKELNRKLVGLIREQENLNFLYGGEQHQEAKKVAPDPDQVKSDILENGRADLAEPEQVKKVQPIEVKEQKVLEKADTKHERYQDKKKQKDKLLQFVASSFGVTTHGEAAGLVQSLEDRIRSIESEVKWEVDSHNHGVENMGFFQKINPFEARRVSKAAEELNRKIDEKEKTLQKLKKQHKVAAAAKGILWEKERPEREKKQQEQLKRIKSRKNQKGLSR